MTPLLLFSIALLIAVLVSEFASRSLLSTAVLFLAAGFVAGHGVLDLMPLRPEDPIVRQLADFALFSVLFTDGMRLSTKDLISAWKLPGRALLFGMPLTACGTALVCHYLAGIPWLQAFLVGAVLSPTDPVFAAAIVGRKEIPHRLRHLLNVESGINDGLALPAVLLLIALLTGRTPGLPLLMGELALGAAIGFAVPWVACRLERIRAFAVARNHDPLFAVAIALLIFSIASIAHANLYISAFTAGVTLANMRPDPRHDTRRFGELIAEILKLAALLVFGALMSPALFRDARWSGFLAAVLILFLVRPAALGISLLGSGLSWKERFVAGWFGPKGFASAIYGLLLLSYGVPDAAHLFNLIAVVISVSILAHSSTDVPVARWFSECAARNSSNRND